MQLSLLRAIRSVVLDWPWDPSFPMVIKSQPTFIQLKPSQFINKSDNANRQKDNVIMTFLKHK